LPPKSRGYNNFCGTFIPVPVDATILQAYAPKKRINVVFPVDVLSKIDETRGKLGERDRSKFIVKRMREYTQKSVESRKTDFQEAQMTHATF